MNYLEKTIREMENYCRDVLSRLKDGKKQTSAQQNKSLIVDDRNDGYYKLIDPKKNNGKPTYRGAFDKDPEVQKVAAYHFFDKAMQIMEKNIRALERCAKELRDVDPNVFLETMPKAYRKQPYYVYNILGIPDLEEWKSRPRRYSEKYPEDKKYRTKQNWQVRSKSECLWANEYYDRGIPCLYEAVQNVNGINMATDFRALETNRYQEMSHEHFGKMDDMEYIVGTFLPKMKAYLKAGYIPGVNLILTFEFKDVPLTPEVINATLDHYFG